MAALRLGEEISGLTAGNGSEGAGEADRRNDGDEPKDERRLEVIIGGSIGSGVVRGVPGFEGAGEAMDRLLAFALEDRCGSSAGAGLFEDIRRAGRSTLLNLPCVESVGVPSLSFSAYMCTERSDDCVATNSLRGSQATPCTKWLCSAIWRIIAPRRVSTCFRRL